MAERGSNCEVWLLGKPIGSLSTSRLPTCLDALLLVQYYHVNEGQTIATSLNQACQRVVEVWDGARIPTQRIDSCSRKLLKLFNRYKSLKKNRRRERDGDKMKQDLFRTDIQQLFDIATSDAMIRIINKDDREFLCKQRKDVHFCCMTGSDKVTTDEGERKRGRVEKKERYQDQLDLEKAGASARVLSIASPSSLDADQEDYNALVPIASLPGSPSAKRPKKNEFENLFKSQEVIETMDRANLSDQSAASVTGAVVKASDHDLSLMTGLQSSICHQRESRKKRQTKFYT